VRPGRQSEARDGEPSDGFRALDYGRRPIFSPARQRPWRQGRELDVALYNVEGRIYATHNICTHAQALLSDGWLDGDVIECPLHGGRFDVKTGKGLGAPITCDLKILPVRIEGDTIQVNVSG
jgi:nitrite reductase/ring-hydroxylating ferredoxin subunit